MLHWRYFVDVINIYTMLILSKLTLIMWVGLVQSVEGIKNKSWGLPEKKFNYIIKKENHRAETQTIILEREK